MEKIVPFYFGENGNMYVKPFPKILLSQCETPQEVCEWLLDRQPRRETLIEAISHVFKLGQNNPIQQAQTQEHDNSETVI